MGSCRNSLPAAAFCASFRLRGITRMKNAFGIIIAGSIAGIAGAALWAFVAYKLGLEIGWIAWIIGALVGFAVSMAGGQGGNAGLVAAAIAVLAICGGKIATVEMTISRGIEKGFASTEARASFEKMRTAAPAFRKVTSRDQYPAFMIAHRFTEAAKPEEVTPEELERFEQSKAPDLQDFENRYRSFDEWKTKKSQSITLEIGRSISLWDELKATLGFFDVIFFCLGIGTAIRVGSGQTNER